MKNKSMKRSIKRKSLKNKKITKKILKKTKKNFKKIKKGGADVSSDEDLEKEIYAANALRRMENPHQRAEMRKKSVRDKRFSELQRKSEEIQAEISRILTCPITQEEIKVPFIDSEGHIYERSGIQEWHRMYGTSPLTRRPISIRNDKSLDLIFNIRNLLNLKMDIDKLIYDNISEKTEKDKLLLTEELNRQREQISQLQQNSSEIESEIESLIESDSITSELLKGRMHINPLIIREHSDSIEKMKKEISFLMNKLSDE